VISVSLILLTIYYTRKSIHKSLPAGIMTSLWVTLEDFQNVWILGFLEFQTRGAWQQGGQKTLLNWLSSA